MKVQRKTAALPAVSNWDRVKATFVQASYDLFQDNGPQWAAAIAYYSLLSLFPLLLAVISIASYFIDPVQATHQVNQWLSQYLPIGIPSIEPILKQVVEARGSVSVLSTLALLWSGSRVFDVVTLALNIAYDVDTQYNFWKRILLELVMLLTIGVLFVLALVSSPLLALLLPSGLLLQAVRYAVPITLLLIAFFLMYRFVPRRKIEWNAAALGAVIATALFVVARWLFAFYFSRFGNYNLVYGSLTAGIVLVLWAWILGLILLYAGEIASHAQEIMIEGRHPAEVEARHRLRSPQEDNPPAAKGARAHAQISYSRPMYSGQIDIRRSQPPRSHRSHTSARLTALGLASLGILAGLTIWLYHAGQPSTGQD